MEFAQDQPEPNLSQEEETRKPGLRVKAWWRYEKRNLKQIPYVKETVKYAIGTLIGTTLIAYKVRGSLDKAFRIGMAATMSVMWGHRVCVHLALRKRDREEMQKMQREGRREDIQERLGEMKDQF